MGALTLEIGDRSKEEAQRLADTRGQPHAVIRCRSSGDLEILPLAHFVPIEREQFLVWVTWPERWRYRRRRNGR